MAAAAGPRWSTGLAGCDIFREGLTETENGDRPYRAQNDDEAESDTGRKLCVVAKREGLEHTSANTQANG